MKQKKCQTTTKHQKKKVNASGRMDEEQKSSKGWFIWF